MLNIEETHSAFTWWCGGEDLVLLKQCLSERVTNYITYSQDPPHPLTPEETKQLQSRTSTRPSPPAPPRISKSQQSNGIPRETVLHSLEHEESRHYNPLAPTTDDAEMQVDQDARANQLTKPSCINCKRAGLEATDHPANWTRCPERLRHIGNLRDKTKSRSKPKSAKPLPGNNSGPVPTSSNINRYRPLADTTPSIENILQSAQQRHLNRITEGTAQQALADIQKTLSKWIVHPPHPPPPCHQPSK